MKDKYFIITVDTEGDNLWNYNKGDEVQTKNTLFIPRFQELCEKYFFKPVYLTNYEMILSSEFVQYIKPKVEAGLCEVGIHIHAWNNPPYYDLNGPYNGNPYLIEYPYDVMREKFKVTYDLICERIGVPPVSHRAGRWAMNYEYFKLLNEFGITHDCSYTPLIKWDSCPGISMPHGSDYSGISSSPHYIDGILEVPMTIKRIRFTSKGSLMHKARVLCKGSVEWLRPATTTFHDMKAVCNVAMKNDNVLEYMIHSSELMPGGSPYFKDENSINKLFDSMEGVFCFVTKKGYKGIALKDYEYSKKIN